MPIDIETIRHCYDGKGTRITVKRVCKDLEVTLSGGEFYVNKEMAKLLGEALLDAAEELGD